MGSTRQVVASVATVASAPPLPSGLKLLKPVRLAPRRIDRPRMPLQVIMTAANTVSRPRVAALSPPDSMRVTIRATSMTVTATASSSEPNGSPTRWATTSAWCTAASTEAPSRIATTTTTTGPSTRPQVRASASTAGTGAIVVQVTRLVGEGAMPPVLRTPALRLGRG